MENGKSDGKTEFEQGASGGQMSILTEFYYFLAENKKWWLVPILLVLGIVGALAILGSTAAAPFIYTLF